MALLSGAAGSGAAIAGGLAAGLGVAAAVALAVAGCGAAAAVALQGGSSPGGARGRSVPTAVVTPEGVKGEEGPHKTSSASRAAAAAARRRPGVKLRFCSSARANLAMAAARAEGEGAAPRSGLASAVPCF